MGYWEPIFIISIFCLGLRTVSDEDMVLFPFRKYFLDRYEKFDRYRINISKPIIICVTCMPSIWGTIIWWGIFIATNEIFHWWTIPVYILSIVSSSFINSVGWATFELIRKY